MGKFYGKGGVRVDIIKDHWDLAGRQILQSIPAGLEFGGFAIERHAKQHAAVDTGRYRSSIGHSQAMLTEKGKRQGTVINASDAVWRITKGIGGIWLYMGSNVQYAPDLEARDSTLYNALMAMHPLVMQGLKKAIQGGMTII